MSDADMKQSDRLVFRISNALHAAITQLAASANRSFNREICMAVESWLYDRDSLGEFKNRLLSTIDAEAASNVKRSLPVIGSNECTVDRRKTTVRLKDKVEVDLRAEWKKLKSSEGHISLNALLVQAVNWWVTYSYQIAECTKAIQAAWPELSLRNRQHSSSSLAHNSLG